jgi:hypothetical protein
MDLAERAPDGVREVALIALLDEMGERLGVGLRRQAVAARLEAVAQLAEVLDDAVVDDRDLAGAVLVGMRVEVVGPAVGRPARVREADRGVRVRSAMAARRLASLPARFSTNRSPPSSTRAMPAES